MKKIIAVTMMSWMLLMGSTFANECKPAIPNPPGFWIRLDLTFHRPKTECKTGFGICADLTCGVDSPVQSTDPSHCLVKARINERNQLEVEIAEEELAKYERGATLPFFKGKTSITLEEPYTLSPAACRALGSSVPLTIKAGNYPVTYVSPVYTVVFQL